MKKYSPFISKIFEKYIKGFEHPMKQRIISNIHKKFNYKRILSNTKFDFCMALDLRDLVQKKIFFNGEWEANLSLFINKELKATDIFFDIGCNVGYFSLLAAKKNTEVFSFDPDPKNIEVLIQNCDINKLKNITPLNFGLGDKNENLQFFRSNIANNGQSGFINRNSTENFHIPVLTLDSLIYDQKTIPIPTFLKIDTEGWEEKILIGATHLLKTDPPRIIIFESEFLGDQSINDFDSIKAFLSQNNYTIVDTLEDEYGVNHVAHFNTKKS